MGQEQKLKDRIAKEISSVYNGDPSPLVNYIMTLMETYKPLDQQKLECAAQLTVFLGPKTYEFVESLFKSIQEWTIPKYMLEEQKPSVFTDETTAFDPELHIKEEAPDQYWNPFESMSGHINDEETCPFPQQIQLGGTCTSKNTFGFNVAAPKLTHWFEPRRQGTSPVSSDVVIIDDFMSGISMPFPPEPPSPEFYKAILFKEGSFQPGSCRSGSFRPGPLKPGHHQSGIFVPGSCGKYPAGPSFQIDFATVRDFFLEYFDTTITGATETENTCMTSACSSQPGPNQPEASQSSPTQPHPRNPSKSSSYQSDSSESPCFFLPHMSDPTCLILSYAPHQSDQPEDEMEPAVEIPTPRTDAQIRQLKRKSAFAQLKIARDNLTSGEGSKSKKKSKKQKTETKSRVATETSAATETGASTEIRIKTEPQDDETPNTENPNAE